MRGGREGEKKGTSLSALFYLGGLLFLVEMRARVFLIIFQDGGRVVAILRQITASHVNSLFLFLSLFTFHFRFFCLLLFFCESSSLPFCLFSSHLLFLPLFSSLCCCCLCFSHQFWPPHTRFFLLLFVRGSVSVSLLIPKKQKFFWLFYFYFFYKTNFFLFLSLFLLFLSAFYSIFGLFRFDFSFSLPRSFLFLLFFLTLSPVFSQYFILIARFILQICDNLLLDDSLGKYSPWKKGRERKKMQLSPVYHGQVQ